MARPTLYTPELGNAICGRIGDGESLQSIVRDDAMPDRSTVYRWLIQNEEFRDTYAHAREDQADTLADQIILIADDSDADHNDRRIRIDARKWVAAKLKPKKYSDKTIVGGDADMPLRMEISWEPDLS